MPRIAFLFAATLMAAIFVPAHPIQATETAADSAGLPAWSRTWTTGYDSRYVLYGHRLNRHFFHADFSVYGPLAEPFSVWAGMWAGALADGSYREVDVYAGLDLALTERLSLGLGFTLFGYIRVPFSDRDYAGEWAACLSYWAGDLTLAVWDHYDLEAEGRLVRAVAAYAHPVTGPVSLRGEAEYGHAFGYYIEGSDAHHALFTLGVPVRLSKSVTAEPYIARSFALRALRAFEPHVTYGGVSFTWTW